MIVSGFRAALDLNTYPLSNLIRPRCVEWAKPGRGKPVLIMHVGFFSCFHVISLEHRLSTVILAAHACRGLIIHLYFDQHMQSSILGIVLLLEVAKSHPLL